MADEIKCSLTVNYANGGAKATFSPGQISIDQTTQGFHSQIVEVGTAEEDMPVGDIDTDGVLVLQNLDATNYLWVGVDAADSSGTVGAAEFFGKIKPGEYWLLRLIPGKQLRWKADTAAIRVFMMLFED